MVEYKPRKEVFRRGYGVYTCRSCGKRTRGNEESIGVQLCGRCYDEASLQNSLSDGIISQQEYDEKLARISKKYGSK